MPVLMISAAVMTAGGCSRSPSPASGVVQTAGAPVGGTTVGPIPGPQQARPQTRNPLANDPRALQDGRRLFVRFNCSGCHGDHAGGGMGPSLRDVPWIYGNAPAQIFDSIAAGRSNGMPAWGTRLPAGEIWKLVTYVQSLRTPQEPDPPT